MLTDLREQYRDGNVFWIYAANAARFTQAFQDIAGQLLLPGYNDPKVDACGLVCRWLDHDEHGDGNGGGRHWLMILDNADDANLFLHQRDPEPTSAELAVSPACLVDSLLRPLNTRGFLLVTTRNRDVGEELARGEPCIEVNPFSNADAGALLQRKAQAGVMDERTTKEDVERLVYELGYIPLAITQAVAFMNRNKITVLKYLMTLQKDQQVLKRRLNTELRDHRRDQKFPSSVFQTWQISFKQIRQQQPRAAEMLSLMAMLDGQQIPEALLQTSREDIDDFHQVIGTLSAYSLIRVEIGEEILTVHPLVQLSVQCWLEEEDKVVDCAGNALQIIADKFPDGEHENRETCVSLLPHARAVLQHFPSSDCHVENGATLLHNVGWFEWRQGWYQAASESVQVAYALRHEVLGDGNRETLDSLALFAMVLDSQGKYQEAEEINQQTLALTQTVLGERHPDTLTSMNNLAQVLSHQGKYQEAEEINRQTLASMQIVLGERHPDTLTSMNNLAQVLGHQGKYQEAEEINRQTLVLKQIVLERDILTH